MPKSRRCRAVDIATYSRSRAIVANEGGCARGGPSVPLMPARTRFLFLPGADHAEVPARPEAGIVPPRKSCHYHPERPSRPLAIGVSDLDLQPNTARTMMQILPKSDAEPATWQ